jgi:hypothetical protein
VRELVRLDRHGHAGVPRVVVQDVVLDLVVVLEPQVAVRALVREILCHGPFVAPGRSTVKTMQDARGEHMSGLTTHEVLEFALTLERSYEALVRGRVKVRVGRLVYLAFSRDETMMGFAHPKDERDALIASAPDTFLLPRPADLRYNWVVVRLDRIDHDEMRELVLDAWGMVVPKKLFAARLAHGL